MHPNPLIWIAVAVLVGYAIWGRKRNGAIAREIRMMRAIKGVAATYRWGLRLSSGENRATCAKDAGKESGSLSSSLRDRSTRDFRTARPRDVLLVECRDNPGIGPRLTIPGDRVSYLG